MDTLYFDRIFDDELSQADIENFLRNNLNGFELIYNYSYIGTCKSSLDVMYDHLQLSYCIEKILNFGELIDHEEITKFRSGIIFKIIPRDIERLAETLLELCITNTQQRDPDEWDIFSIHEALLEYEQSLEKKIFRFPDAIDSYYANLINQGIFELANEAWEEEIGEEKFLRKKFRENPEWQWGIWRSPASNTLNETFYVSSYCWIIPKVSNDSAILKSYSGFRREIFFEQAVLLEYSEKKIAINDYGAVQLDNLVSFEAAFQCANLHLNKLFKFPPSKQISLTDCKFFISEYRDVLVLQSENFKFVYFDFTVIRHEELKSIWGSISNSVGHIQNLLGVTSDLRCDWSLLNDDSFEELCYDIISMHTKFDSERVRKMGKSKSRDGGRDIVAYTKQHLGRKSEKYIFQCKFLSSKSSLTKSKVPEAANVIMEYGAQGYGIFTSCVIDSTLYDMLDGFHVRGIDTDNTFSIYELERILARNAGLRKKYFG